MAEFSDIQTADAILRREKRRQRILENSGERLKRITDQANVHRGPAVDGLKEFSSIEEDETNGDVNHEQDHSSTQSLNSNADRYSNSKASNSEQSKNMSTSEETVSWFKQPRVICGIILAILVRLIFILHYDWLPQSLAIYAATYIILCESIYYLTKGFVRPQHGYVMCMFMFLNFPEWVSILSGCICNSVCRISIDFSFIFVSFFITDQVANFFLT